MMSDSELKRIAARADLCRLLAACYYEPGPEFAEERIFDSMRVAAAEVDRELAPLVDAMEAAFGATPLDELRVDYTRLFLNPGAPLAAPYESMWVARKDPMAAEQVNQSVLAIYREGGFDMDEGFRDLPDHIAAELEFLYTLLFREARTALSGPDGERQAVIALRQRFIDLHLGRWIEPLADAMREGAESGLYRALADLTERFVRAEAR